MLSEQSSSSDKIYDQSMKFAFQVANKMIDANLQFLQEYNKSPSPFEKETLEAILHDNSTSHGVTLNRLFKTILTVMIRSRFSAFEQSHEDSY